MVVTTDAARPRALLTPRQRGELAKIEPELSFTNCYEDWYRFQEIVQKENRLDRAYLDSCGLVHGYGCLITRAYLERDRVEELVGQHKALPLFGTEWEPLFAREVFARRDLALLESYLEPSIALSLEQFFYHLPARPAPCSDPRADEFKGGALGGYDVWIEILDAAGLDERAAEIRARRERLATESFKKPLAKPDPAKMDDALFWSLIRESAEGSDSMAEQQVRLGARLEDFGGAAIRAFGVRYGKAMRALYHWNVWALAYASRGGCGDDAFHAFREWLILRGDPALLERAIEDPALAAAEVPADVELPSGGLGHVIAQASLARTGKMGKGASTTLLDPKGREWDESDIAERYPELCERYGLVDESSGTD